MGPQDSLVGIFIFKGDNKNQLAWEDASEIARMDAENRAAREFARVELHTQRESFLEGLRAWQREVRDPENAHLLIYAHACALGITPTETVAELVTWNDLGDALPQGVAVLWLVGCKSEYVRRTWTTPAASPVRASLLVTTEALDWHQLIPHFRAEVDINNFVLFDRMKSYLRQRASQVGQEVTYLDASHPDWEEFPEHEYVDYSHLPPLTLKELQALWPTRDPEEE